MKITPLTLRCAVEIDSDRFLDLLDSESYVTDNAAYEPGVQTLDEKLHGVADVADIDYNGHFGAMIYFTINADADQTAVAAEIEPIINSHLDWCAGLTKVAHIVERRSLTTNAREGQSGGRP